MTRKSTEKKGLESGVRSLEEEGVVNESLTTAGEVPEGQPYERTFLDEQILAEQEERIRIAAEEQKRYRYDQYFMAALAGAHGFYGIIVTDLDRVQLLAHRAACAALASEQARHESLSELQL